jgi:hypothetical protein
MINLEAIISAPIVNDPWPHKVIDNILDDITFEKFRQAAITLSKTEKDEFYADGLWPNEFSKFGLDSSLESLAVSIADQLLTINKDILDQFPNHIKSNMGYFNIPRFNFTNSNIHSKIHDEGQVKAMALIIYLIPEETVGTRLYNGPTLDHFVKEIEWKPNRAFLMISQPNITWHNYIGKGDPRYTLNLYFEKMESLENLDNLKLDRKLWFYDMFGQNKLYITN